MSVLDRVRAHADPDKRRSLCVPEWGEADASLVLYYGMVTLGDLEAAQVSANAAGGSVLRMEAELVCLKAQDEAGKPLFKRIDAKELMEAAAPEVVRRIANQMMARTSIEDAAKN
jgi:hypothetical protein